jgi:hypothetical protein
VAGLSMRCTLSDSLDWGSGSRTEEFRARHWGIPLTGSTDSMLLWGVNPKSFA